MMAMSAREFMRKMQDGTLNDDGTYCAGPCKQRLDFTTGRQRTKDGLLCDDCYFEALGKLVEEHPIATPGGRRG